jgi:transposase
MRCGSGWRRSWLTRRAASATRAAAVTRRRACLEGILYVLYTDTPWLQVPYRELGLPSGETCRRRLEEWSRRGLFQQAIRVLQEQLAGADKLDWSRVIVDASLVEAKRGARRSRARGAARPAAASTS